MQKITPFIWFEDQAEAAVKLYTSLIENSKIGRISRYDAAGAKGSGRPEGTVMTVSFQLAGQEFTALNGGPGVVTGNGPISFVVNCETQDEVDELWDKLSEGGKQIQCGWLVDKYGVTWQIVPTILIELLASQDKAKASRVMAAMLKMKKLDIDGLKKAAEE